MKRGDNYRRRRTVDTLRIDVVVADGQAEYRIFVPDQRKRNKLAKLQKWERIGSGFTLGGTDEHLILGQLLKHLRGHYEYMFHSRRIAATLRRSRESARAATPKAEQPPAAPRQP